MIKLRSLRTFVHDDLVRRGQIFDVAKGDAQQLIARGLAVAVVEEPAPEPVAKKKPEPKAEKA